jgi:hypothetical protein
VFYHFGSNYICEVAWVIDKDWSTGSNALKRVHVYCAGTSHILTL